MMRLEKKESEKPQDLFSKPVLLSYGYELG